MPGQAGLQGLENQPFRQENECHDDDDNADHQRHVEVLARKV